MHQGQLESEPLRKAEDRELVTPCLGVVLPEIRRHVLMVVLSLMDRRELCRPGRHCSGQKDERSNRWSSGLGSVTSFG